jgi:hypothetical protein
MSLKETYQRVRSMARDRVSMHASYRRVFDTPDGEVVLRHIIRAGMVTRPTFVAGDPHMTSFHEGQRHLALSILRFARRDHEEIIKQVERGLVEGEIT